MEAANLVSKRTTCLRRRVGAVLVKDKRILATGYNGAPSGIAHCLEIGCLREKLKIPSGERHELCRGLHAEQNVLIQAALHGISTRGSVLYLTNQPCIICAKMLINAAVKEIIMGGDYPDKMAKEFLKEAGIKIRRVK
ncbi:MAG: cytidine/deoxycytidylate deaminase family protein [Candidatus Omnitrophica bacterium]|nr:cytidine/deoxycytidylate deaminase family protein [Candidatus Omnitrophota bacterium]